MAEFTVGISLDVSDETAKACEKLLNIYLERHCNKVSLMYNKPDDRFPYFSIEVLDKKTYDKAEGGD